MSPMEPSERRTAESTAGSLAGAGSPARRSCSGRPGRGPRAPEGAVRSRPPASGGATDRPRPVRRFARAAARRRAARGRAGDGGRILATEGDRVRAGTPLVRLESPSSRRRRSTRGRRRCGWRRIARAPRRARRAGAPGEASCARSSTADARLLAGRSDHEAPRPRRTSARWRRPRTACRGRRGRALGASTVGPLAARSRRAARRPSSSARVAALTVRAPFDGVVYGLPRRVGETVSAGQVVANVIDPQHRRLRARVDQPDLPRIAVGQRLQRHVRRASARALGRPRDVRRRRACARWAGATSATSSARSPTRRRGSRPTPPWKSRS